MIRFYMPYVLFATGTSLIKFLFMLLHNQSLHGGIICWINLQNISRFK